MPIVSRTALTVLFAGLVLLVGCRGEPPFPELWTAPTYRLVDQRNQPFGSADLAGRASVVDFIYTSCTDTCPLLSATFARVQERLREDGLLGSPVQLVSISVDPLRDTPEVLAEYGGRFGADPDNWRLLTGDPGSVFAVLAGFQVTTVEAAMRAAETDEVPHSERIMVVDPAGKVRAALRGAEVAPEEVVRAVRSVL